MRALVVGVVVAAVCAAQGSVHAENSSSCDFEGVRITHRSSKYIVGRANKRGSIYGSCDSGTLTCYEDTGLADAPQGLNARVIDCDARLVNSRRRKLGVAINLLEDKWPKGLVWYRFSSKNALPESEREIVRQAMKTYEATDLGVAFQECEPTSLCSNKYVDISQKEDACYSYVGFTGEGGGQIMNLGKSCFEEPGTALHELGHALGLYHEHTHPEREVIVLTDGNLPVSASNYAKETDANLKPYDKASIMHYGRSAGLCLPKDQYPLESFCDVEITTNCVMPKKTHCNNTRNAEIGQRSQLSPGDLNTLKAIYGTKKPTLVPTSAPAATTAAPAATSTDATPKPSTTTSAPSTQTPAPSTAPTTTQPSPVTTAPTPTTAKPTPTTETPTPPKTATPPPPPSTPAPTTVSPVPTTGTPAPTTGAPTPTTTQPATVPATVTPVPSMTQSAPTTSAPTPTTERPTQNSPSPAPKTSSPSPMTSSPAPSPIATAAPPTPTVPTTPATPPSTQPTPTTPRPLTKSPSPAPQATTRAPRPAHSMTLAPPVAPTTPATTSAPEASAPPVAPVTPRPVTPAVPLAPTRTATPIAVPTTRPGVLPVSPPTPTATSYNPGVVKPDAEQNSLWWSWWSTAGSNKRWADLPWAQGNGRWWPSSSSTEVSYDADNSPVQQSVPKSTTKAPAKAMQTKKPTPAPKAKKTHAPPMAKGSYSFRGWGQ